MRRTQAELQDEIRKEVFLLRTLRDDAVRLLHRGGPEAEREWQLLEPCVLSALARAEREVSDDACWAVTRAAGQMRNLCARLR
jgi:hypothetical protein